MSINSSDLGRLTASWTLEKCGVSALGGLAGGAAGQLGAALTNPTPTNNRPGSFLNPGGVQPGGGGALPGTQQQRQQAMQNPVSRQQYIQQAKQQEQQRMAGGGIDNTPGSPYLASQMGSLQGLGQGAMNVADPLGTKRQMISTGAKGLQKGYNAMQNANIPSLGSSAVGQGIRRGFGMQPRGGAPGAGAAGAAAGAAAGGATRPYNPYATGGKTPRPAGAGMGRGGAQGQSGIPPMQ